MDGKQLLYELRQILNEDSSSAFLDDRTSYKFLYDAAITLASMTGVLTGTQTITTVANQANYSLNPDFIRIALVNDDGSPIIKYTDGSNGVSWLSHADRSVQIRANNTTSSRPSTFSVQSAALNTRLTGTATSSGAASNGEATLTNSGANFTNVAPGDVVHNTTDGADGFVLSKTSNTALVTALFGGSGNDWQTSDAYVIQPQGRFELYLDAPPDTSSETLTVYYVKRPDPVFSPYGAYPFPAQYNQAMLCYAAWLYKYRDREPNYGDAFYKFWDLKMRESNAQSNAGLNRKIKINLRGR